MEALLLCLSHTQPGFGHIKIECFKDGCRHDPWKGSASAADVDPDHPSLFICGRSQRDPNLLPCYEMSCLCTITRGINPFRTCLHLLVNPDRSGLADPQSRLLCQLNLRTNPKAHQDGICL